MEAMVVDEILQQQIIEFVKENQPVFMKDLIQNIHSLNKDNIYEELNDLYSRKELQLKKDFIYIYNDNINIQDVEDVMMMSRTIKSGVSIISAITTMILEDMDFLIVVKDFNLEGVVSKKDIIKKVIIEKIDAQNTPIDCIMTKMPNIIYAKNTDKVAFVIDVLMRNEINSIPVVKVEHDEKNNKDNLKVIGVFNKTIITRLYRDLYQQ